MKPCLKLYNFKWIPSSTPCHPQVLRQSGFLDASLSMLFAKAELSSVRTLRGFATSRWDFNIVTSIESQWSNGGRPRDGLSLYSYNMERWVVLHSLSDIFWTIQALWIWFVVFEFAKVILLQQGINENEKKCFLFVFLKTTNDSITFLQTPNI